MPTESSGLSILDKPVLFSRQVFSHFNHVLFWDYVQINCEVPTSYYGSLILSFFILCCFLFLFPLRTGGWSPKLKSFWQVLQYFFGVFCLTQSLLRKFYLCVRDSVYRRICFWASIRWRGTFSVHHRLLLLLYQCYHLGPLLLCLRRW